MGGTYTYDPSEITGYGSNRMRFELGDTIVDGGRATAVLADEEYEQMISEHPTNWKRAKLKCLDAIVMRLSYEVNTSLDGLSYSLDSRAERWRRMQKELKKELSCGVPTARKGSYYGPSDPHYFHKNMQANMTYPHDN